MDLNSRPSTPAGPPAPVLGNSQAEFGKSPSFGVKAPQPFSSGKRGEVNFATLAQSSDLATALARRPTGAEAVAASLSRLRAGRKMILEKPMPTPLPFSLFAMASDSSFTKAKRVLPGKSVNDSANGVEQTVAAKPPAPPPTPFTNSGPPILAATLRRLCAAAPPALVTAKEAKASPARKRTDKEEAKTPKKEAKKSSDAAQDDAAEGEKKDELDGSSPSPAKRAQRAKAANVPEPMDADIKVDGRAKTTPKRALKITIDDNSIKAPATDTPAMTEQRAKKAKKGAAAAAASTSPQGPTTRSRTAAKKP